MTAKHDVKLIAALDEIPEEMQAKMRRALRDPHTLGAWIGGAVKARTRLGYAVHSGFVTPLGAEMIRAASAPVELTEHTKKPRARKAAS